MSETNGKKDWGEDESHNLPPEMQAALEKFLREHRVVFEALARL